MGYEMSDKAVALFDAITSMAKSFAASNLFGQNKPEVWASLMFIAHAEGKHPASVAREYHFIDGKPTLRAEAMLARFQESGGRVAWLESSDEKVAAQFIHPQGGEITIEWTIARAIKAGLSTRKVWANHPQQMLRARTISEGVRALYPVVLNGMYTPQEIEAGDDVLLQANNRKTVDVNQLPRPAIVELPAQEFDSLIARVQFADAETAADVKAECSALKAKMSPTQLQQIAAAIKANDVFTVKKQEAGHE